jgi:hypothetical protein
MILSKLSCQWRPKSESVLYNFCLMGLSLMVGWNQQQLKQKMFHKVSNSWTQSSKMNNPCWIFLEMWDPMKIYNVSSWVLFLGQSFATWQPKKSSVTCPKDSCELKNTKVARIQGIFFSWNYHIYNRF